MYKIIYIIYAHMGSFSGGSDSKEFACNAGELSSVPGSRRFPGEGNDYRLQFSGLENSMEEPGGLQSRGSKGVRHD